MPEDWHVLRHLFVWGGAHIRSPQCAWAPADLPHKRLEQCNLNSGSSDEIKVTYRRGRRRPSLPPPASIFQLPWLSSRRKQGGGKKHTCLPRAGLSASGVHGAMQAWSPGGKASLCFHPGPALAFSGPWPMAGVSWTCGFWPHDTSN